MTTPTTPAHAMELAELIDAGEASAESADAMRSLAQQVEALTADLAAEKLFSSQAMESVTEIAAQRDALKPDADRYKKLRARTKAQRGPSFDQMWLILPDVKRLPDQNIMQGSVAQHLDKAVDAMEAAS